MKYFKIEEFRCKDGSVTPEEAKVNLTALVENVLDPARERYGAAIHVNSGYRTETYNKKVGGANGSQHCCKNGSAAADVCCEDNRRLARVFVEQGKFDQLILYPTLTMSTSDATRKSSSEHGSSSLLPRFIHVSWKRQGGNRCQVLRKTATGYQKVDPSKI